MRVRSSMLRHTRRRDFPRWRSCLASSQRCSGKSTTQSNLNYKKHKSMRLSGIPFKTTDWSKIEQTEHKGERGPVYWRTQQFGSVRVRWSTHQDMSPITGVTKGTSSFVLKVNYTPSYKTVAYYPHPRDELSSSGRCRTSPFIHRDWCEVVRCRLS